MQTVLVLEVRDIPQGPLEKLEKLNMLEAEAEVAEPLMELPLLVAPEALALFSYD